MELHDEGDIVWSSPTVANGIVYIGSCDHNVYALDAMTGGVAWSFLTGDAVDSSPTIVNDIVYVGSNDHNIYAIGKP
jgi:outer membrane protein assembly factor BamB